MEDSPDEDWSAGSWIRTIAEFCYNDYLECWELRHLPDDPSFSEDERRRHGRLKDLARAIVPCLHTLRTTPEAMPIAVAIMTPSARCKVLKRLISITPLDYS